MTRSFGEVIGSFGEVTGSFREVIGSFREIKGIEMIGPQEEESFGS